MYSLIIHRRAVACIAVALPALDSTSYTCKSSVSDSSVRPLPIPVNPRRETTAHKNAALASLTIMILSEAWTHAYTWDFMKLVVSASCDQTGKVSSRIRHNAPQAHNHEQNRCVYSEMQQRMGVAFDIEAQTLRKFLNRGVLI